MIDYLAEFEGGNASAREKLNRAIRYLNALLKMRGDEAFISVNLFGETGATVKLNIDAILARIPKQRFIGTNVVCAVTSSGTTDSGGFPLYGGGWYIGVVWEPPKPEDVDWETAVLSDLTDDAIRARPVTDPQNSTSCLIMNMREVNKGTHDIYDVISRYNPKYPPYFIGEIRGYTRLGYPVVAIDACPKGVQDIAYDTSTHILNETYSPLPPEAQTYNPEFVQIIDFTDPCP